MNKIFLKHPINNFKTLKKYTWFGGITEYWEGLGLPQSSQMRITSSKSRERRTELDDRQTWIKEQNQN